MLAALLYLGGCPTKRGATVARAAASPEEHTQLEVIV